MIQINKKINKYKELIVSLRYFSKLPNQIRLKINRKFNVIKI